MSTDVAALRALYDAAGQSHVFTFYDRLAPAEQAALVAQLASVDVARVNRIYANAVAADPTLTPGESDRRLDDHHLGPGLIATDKGASRSPSPAPDEVLPLPEAACATIVNNAADEARWRARGLDAVAANKVAVLLMAGGQGTRLGSASPKGMYDIGLPSGMTLFEIQAARIRRLEKVAEERTGTKGVRIRWYVMTSGPTRTETKKYFEEKGYFGLKKDDVVFFEQGVLPALSSDGKLLLSTPSSIALSPDGNGGLYAALRRPLGPGQPSPLEDLHAHGIEYIHTYGVDNCLVRVADPVFLGCCIERNAASGVKCVRKVDPTESVGVLAKRGDAYAVVEYSELSKEKAAQRDATGQLAFRAANIVNHFFTTAYLDGVEAMERRMAFHIARKKIPTVDLATGAPFTPATPNGMKLELFIFDVFPFTPSLCVLEVERAGEFSPLKNAPGSKTDGPETSRRDLLALMRKWIVAAGAAVDDGVDVEVTPEVTYGGEGLEFLHGKVIKRSGVIRRPEDVAQLV
ncbi:UDP-N-acetylglucosamine pyrophosphorylase [Cryptotrichosporon argae]